MAKRKRLSPAAITQDPRPIPEDLETKAVNGWVGVRSRPPIAKVAGEAAAQSAFEEVAEELRSAKAQGRMVARLPLDVVDAAHLVRDRVVLDAGEMEVLRESLKARGQQTPIEVVELPGGRYGLISGWRRLTALAHLLEQTGDTERFGHVQALVRAPDGAAEAYQAMVEENEVRADLSFYERARIAVRAAAQGIYPDTHTAVQSLFSTARRPKRSKITNFTRLVDHLDDVLRFPAAIPEKLGLRLAALLQDDPGAAARLRKTLEANPPEDAGAERALLEHAFRTKPESATATRVVNVAPGVTWRAGKGSLVLRGAGIDDALLDDLRAWFAARNRQKFSSR